VQPRKTNARRWLQQKNNKRASERKLRRVGAAHPLHSHMRKPARSTPSATSQLGARAQGEPSSAQWLHPTQPRATNALEQQRGRQLHGEKHEADGSDENVIFHAVPRIEGSARQSDLRQLWWAQQQLHSRQLQKGRVAARGEGILRTKSRTWSMPRKSAVRNAGIYYARGALSAQRLACAERGAKRWISRLLKIVCPSSTTSTRRRYDVTMYGAVCAVASAVAHSVGQPQGMRQLRVAERAAATGKVCSLARRCPNVDGMHCLRGLRSSCRCSALCRGRRKLQRRRRAERRGSEGRTKDLCNTCAQHFQPLNMKETCKSRRGAHV
jgi:hypothetical protein